METPTPALPRAFWVGVAVGVGFRGFAYSLSFAALLLLPPHIPGIPPLISNLLPPVCWVAAYTSIFWIPFASGFLSVYFWRHLEEKDYIAAIRHSAIGFIVVSIVLSVVIHLVALPCFLLLFIFLDVAMCVRGGDLGKRFWNGLLGRQFLGDFSTIDAGSSNHSEGVVE